MLRRCITFVALAALIGVTSPARATPATVVTAAYYTFWPGDVRWPELQLHMTQGSTLVFANLGTEAPHNLTEFRDPPRFSSGEPLDPGKTAVVQGAETLPPGAYPFVCRVHPDLMNGLLVVDPA